MLSNLFLAAETPATTWIFVALLVVLVVVLLVVPMFTNKKRQKETNEMHNSLKPGDVIKTVGGIVGTIVDIRTVSPTEKELVIETGVGDNKSTMVVDIQALYQIMSRAPESSNSVFGSNDGEDNGAKPAEAFAPIAAETEVAEEPAHATEETVAEEPAEEAAEAIAKPVDPAAEEAATDNEVAEEPVEEKPAEEEPAESVPAHAPASNSGKKKGGAKKSTKK